ncbi:hypothetical protein [Noviherbaspirillum sp. ST9]|uniref:hypothetical protein n=1 Tax=Noviherbaspirillum sp. ST9 TaxID=3401606 RepID=UPI003B58A69F
MVAVEGFHVDVYVKGGTAQFSMRCGAAWYGTTSAHNLLKINNLTQMLIFDAPQQNLLTQQNFSLKYDLLRRTKEV